MALTTSGPRSPLPRVDLPGEDDLVPRVILLHGKIESRFGQRPVQDARMVRGSLSGQLGNGWPAKIRRLRAWLPVLGNSSCCKKATLEKFHCLGPKRPLQIKAPCNMGRCSSQRQRCAIMGYENTRRDGDGRRFFEVLGRSEQGTAVTLPWICARIAGCPPHREPIAKAAKIPRPTTRNSYIALTGLPDGRPAPAH
jgi:hypothetical protein